MTTKNLPRGPGAKRSRLLALGVVLLATIPFQNGLRNGFTFDDVRLAAENPRVRSIAGLSI